MQAGTRSEGAACTQPRGLKARTSPSRTLAIAGTAHALRDGYTDLLQVLLPIWQSKFALSYSMVAVLRGFHAGTMASLRLPSGWLAERLNGSPKAPHLDKPQTNSQKFFASFFQKRSACLTPFTRQTGFDIPQAQPKPAA